MKQKKGAPVLVILILLISLIAIVILFANLLFCSDCMFSGKQGESQTAGAPKGYSLTPMNISDESPVYSSYEQAISTLGDTPGLERDHNGRLQVYFIQGQNMDENGQAEKWLFEAKSIGGTEMRVYDRHGWTVIPWNVTHSMEDINIDTVISPSVLFSQNRTLIFRDTSAATSREIELQGNVYTLTLSSANTSVVMKFDATTGALIE